jgi:hypothetical protein
MIDRTDYPILQGISRSAGGAVLTVDTLEAVLEKYHITQTKYFGGENPFRIGDYVVATNYARQGQVGLVVRHGSTPSTWVNFRGIEVEKLNVWLRVATDSEILKERLQHGL